MVSQSKLIKQGIYLTDSLFDEIIRRLTKGIRDSDTLEDFLIKTKDYTMNNPLVMTGYKDDLLEIILKETNNHKFSRPAQKELTRLTIENRVGDLIVDVGDDIKESVRDIVKHGYNNNLSQDEIAETIAHRIGVIKNKRARAIARTEIARTATASDYVINRERGANAFTVDCRNTACAYCKEKVLKNPEREATSKGMTGDVEFSIDDVANLPPFHPNCRCVAMFFIKEEGVENSNFNSDDGVMYKESINEAQYNNSKLNGNPEITIENDRSNGRVTVYTFDSGLELAISEKANFTYEEIVAHINSLPEPLRNIESLKRININGYYHPSAAGDYNWQTKKIELYLDNSSKSEQLNNLTHELAHALDNSKSTDRFGKEFRLSRVELYEKIFKRDNEVHATTNIFNGKKRIRNKFPTDYARKGWNKYKKLYSKALKNWTNGTQNPDLKPFDNRFAEDFAESTQRYLNPATHDDFVKNWPNRAEYLESIYGKPKFDKNSPLYKSLITEGILP